MHGTPAVVKKGGGKVELFTPPSWLNMDDLMSSHLDLVELGKCTVQRTPPGAPWMKLICHSITGDLSCLDMNPFLLLFFKMLSLSLSDFNFLQEKSKKKVFPSNLCLKHPDDLLPYGMRWLCGWPDWQMDWKLNSQSLTIFSSLKNFFERMKEPAVLVGWFPLNLRKWSLGKKCRDNQALKLNGHKLPPVQISGFNNCLSSFSFLSLPSWDVLLWNTLLRNVLL